MVHSSWFMVPPYDGGSATLVIVIGPAPISHELSSIGAGSALRYEILDAHDW